MTRKKRPVSPHGPELFAVECPACLMAVAVAGDLIGSVARCPLCRADFRVPDPHQKDASASQPVAVQASGLQASGPQPDRVEATETQEARALPSAPAPEPSTTPAPAPTAAPAEVAAPAAAETPAAAPASPAQETFASGPPPGLLSGSLTAPPQPQAEPSVPAPLQTDFFDITTETPPATDPELAFREPVRTIVSGDEVIELRRLTPEEKRLRQARRNAVMLLAGALLLILITVLLGRGSGR